jgi:hypothetical protein
VAGQQMIDWSFFSMARYLLTADPADGSVIPGRAWDAFLERLAEAGLLVAGSQLPEAAVDRASAFRGLLQSLYFGLERTLGSADPARPVLSRPWPTHLFDYGAGNPDAVYRTASLRDDVTYRISGRLGNAACMSFEFFDGATQAGSLLARDLRPDASGRFEVMVGPSQRDGHWYETRWAISRVPCTCGSCRRLSPEPRSARARPAASPTPGTTGWQAGHRRSIRTREPNQHPRPTARVVALDDLDAALPDGTARVTPAQRRRVLDERLRQVTRLQRS